MWKAVSVIQCVKVPVLWKWPTTTLDTKLLQAHKENARGVSHTDAYAHTGLHVAQ